MAKLELGPNPTSVIFRVKLMNSSVATGAGLTGLAHDTASLIISTIKNNEATATTYTVTGSTIETIATLATYAAPTATKCRFKEVDSTNHPGLYEIQLADARFASCDSLIVSISGAADLAQCDIEIDLITHRVSVIHQANIDFGALQKASLNAATPASVQNIPVDGSLDVNVASQYDLDFTATQKTYGAAWVTATSVTVSDKTGFSLSATGADLILKSSTFIQAIVAAVNEFATYGLTALNTLLTVTGIKTATTAAPADMATETKQDTIIGHVDGLNGDAMRGTDGANTVAPDPAGTAATLLSGMALDSTVAKEATLATVAGYLDTEIASILEDTGTTIPGTITALAATLKEVNQSLNGAVVEIDRANNTFKVYDTDGETLLFTITKTTSGNVDTLTRT